MWFEFYLLAFCCYSSWAFFPPFCVNQVFLLFYFIFLLASYLYIFIFSVISNIHTYECIHLFRVYLLHFFTHHSPSLTSDISHFSLYTFILPWDTWQASLVARLVKNPPAMQETWVQSVGGDDPPGEGNGTPLQCSCLENPVDRGAWCATVHGVTKSQTRLSDFSFTFHFHALEKGMATRSSVLAWRIPGTGKPGGLPSMGSHRVGHDWATSTAHSTAQTPDTWHQLLQASYFAIKNAATTQKLNSTPASYCVTLVSYLLFIHIL